MAWYISWKIYFGRETTVAHFHIDFCFVAWTEPHKEKLFSKQRGARYKYIAEITYFAETHL